MKTAIAGVAAGASGVLDYRIGWAAARDEPRVKIAGYAYDRVRAIQDGRLVFDRGGNRPETGDFLSLMRASLGNLRKIFAGP